jgi:hypothetical protein
MMGLAEDFDTLLAELPEDWSFFETFVMLDDAADLAEARVALGRANARPVRGPGRVDFEITVANSWGRGALPGVVRSGLLILYDRGVGGHVFAGDARAGAMPAPAHRYGP